MLDANPTTPQPPSSEVRLSGAGEWGEKRSSLEDRMRLIKSFIICFLQYYLTADFERIILIF
jgi:hypothetical protein